MQIGLDMSQIDEITFPEIVIKPEGTGSDNHGQHGGHPDGFPHGPHGGHDGNHPHGPHGGHTEQEETGSDNHVPHGGHPGDKPHGPHGGHIYTTAVTATTTAPASLPEETTLIMNKDAYNVIDTIESDCPSNWLISSRVTYHENHKKFNQCDLKNIRSCTANKFSHKVGGLCHKTQVVKIFHGIVAILSEIAISGTGNRHCIFQLETVDCEFLKFDTLDTAEQYRVKLQVLATHLYSQCGKHSLKTAIQPELDTLTGLMNDEDCSNRNLQFTKITVTTTTLKPERFSDRLSLEEKCSYKYFHVVAAETFFARSYQLKDLKLARENFSELVGVLTTISENPEFDCNLDATKMPCTLVALPKNESGCQLTQRLEQLYLYVADFCNAKFIKTYNSLLDNLIANSRPAVNNCKNVGEPIERIFVKEMDKMYKEEFGSELKSNIKVKVAAQRQIFSDALAEKRKESSRLKFEKSEINFKRAGIQLEKQRKRMERYEKQKAMELRRLKNMQNDVFEEVVEEIEEMNFCLIQQRSVDVYQTRAEDKFSRALTTEGSGIIRADVIRMRNNFSFVLKPWLLKDHNNELFFFAGVDYLTFRHF
jgi:hypothetical protein